MIATREDRIEMAVSLHRQGKSAQACDRQFGLGSGTTKKAAQARGLYNPLRNLSDRQGRIEMALNLYKQGKSADFCDSQFGLKNGTTRQEAKARGLYNPFRKHHGGKRRIHPGMQCAVCLYSVGLGGTVIGRILDASPQAVINWAKNAGVFDIARRENANRRLRSRGLFTTTKPKQTKEERRAKEVEYKRIKFQSDHGFKLKECCRARIYKALKNQMAAKSERTTSLIGCSVDYLKAYLSSMFESGMSWDNYGDWHVDHIIPCSSFDFTDPKQQKLCFHFSNLRPAWARDNMVKSDKMPDSPQLGLLLNA